MTIILFITEIFRVDIIAGIVMLSLAWLGLVTPAQAFSGFGSNAVISIVGVMIMGYGIDRSGAMNRLSIAIVQLAGSREKRLLGVISTVVGLISAFMQNIGSAALFLPALIRISRHTRIPSSRLIMPMGFAAILGGTITMVGSGPLIILNDLLKQGGQEPFGLFSVTPLGLALLFSGIVYFLVFGAYVLPQRTEAKDTISPQQELIETWQLQSYIYCYSIPPGSSLTGKTREDSGLWHTYNLNLLAIMEGDDGFYAPWRYTRFEAGQELGLMGQKQDIVRFAGDHGLIFQEGSNIFKKMLAPEKAGFAEVIIRPRASIAGRTLRQIALRKHYSVEPILLLTGSKEQRTDFSDQLLQPGDTLIVHGPWNAIQILGDDPDFVRLTPVETQSTGKERTAALCFFGAITLAISGISLSLSLLSGALAMILLRVIPISEAYRAVDWRTVVLLAGLIPLGIAMDISGAASLISSQMMMVMQGSHTLLILIAIAALTTLFSLFMSNVAAAVLLVPIVMLIGESTGIDPRALALLVGVCASNSFVLPTHQVNALLMAPGGYHNADYLKAGGIMTLIFIAVSVGIIYLYF